MYMINTLIVCIQIYTNLKEWKGMPIILTVLSNAKKNKNPSVYPKIIYDRQQT